MNNSFEPKIVGIFCNWCTYLAADLAGVSRMQYPPNIRIARVMCSGRVHPEFVLWAFRNGADGVLIGGCHPGDCHYIEGNYKNLRRYLLMKKLLPQLGIDARRLRLEWISASEADKLKRVITEFTTELKELGPLNPDVDLPPIPEMVPPALQEKSIPELDTTRLGEKPKIGFYWCASCGGCEEAVVDLAEDILNVVEKVDIAFWPVAMDFKRTDVEKMGDGELLATFINGAIRLSEQEEMVKLLRQKSQLIIAFGACSHMGGIPGLANVKSKDEIMNYYYDNGPIVVNPDNARPDPEIAKQKCHFELPEFYDSVRALDQVIEVDYYLPGCAPTPNIVTNAIQTLLTGNLPPRGTVLASDRALCHECSLNETKPEEGIRIKEFKRPSEVRDIDPTKCLLLQGLVCLGPVTRGGCGALCIQANMPCTGCFGPLDNVRDFGASALSFIATLVDSNEEAEIRQIFDKGIPDPLGTFYLYSLPKSLLFKSLSPKGKSADVTTKPEAAEIAVTANSK